MRRMHNGQLDLHKIQLDLHSGQLDMPSSKLLFKSYHSLESIKLYALGKPSEVGGQRASFLRTGSLSGWKHWTFQTKFVFLSLANIKPNTLFKVPKFTQLLQCISLKIFFEGIVCTQPAFPPSPPPFPHIP